MSRCSIYTRVRIRHFGDVFQLTRALVGCQKEFTLQSLLDVCVMLVQAASSFRNIAGTRSLLSGRIWVSL